MSVTEHRHVAPTSVNCFVVTISDSRTEETDQSGGMMKQLLMKANHRVNGYKIIKDDVNMIKQTMIELVRRDDIDVILMNGGTGIAKRDVSYEAVNELLEKEMTGFGELFRYLSYEEIGPAAMLSRAIAGVYENRAIFLVPGSTGAVRLAMEKLILPEIGHVVRELKKV